MRSTKCLTNIAAHQEMFIHVIYIISIMYTADYIYSILIFKTS